MIYLLITMPDPCPKARKRKIEIDAIAKQALWRGKPQADHGGTVCNSYGYSADTETALACPIGGAVVVWRSSISANKATLSGAALSCMAPAADLFDGRVKNKERIRVADERVRYFARLVYEAVGGETAIQWAREPESELGRLPFELALEVMKRGEVRGWILKRIETAVERAEVA